MLHRKQSIMWLWYWQIILAYNKDDELKLMHIKIMSWYKFYYHSNLNETYRWKKEHFHTHRSLIHFDLFLPEIWHLLKRIDRYQYGSDACLIAIKESLACHCQLGYCYTRALELTRHIIERRFNALYRLETYTDLNKKCSINTEFIFFRVNDSVMWRHRIIAHYTECVWSFIKSYLS